MNDNDKKLEAATIAVRKELSEIVRTYYYNQPSLLKAFDSSDLGWQHSEDADRIFDLLTVAQYFRLYRKFVLEQKEFQILPCNPVDHLAVKYCGMYVGIEHDGYAHT